MTGNVHDYSKFQYFAEDCECKYCLHKANKSETHGRGCIFEECPYSDIRNDAILNGRIKRARGWNRHNHSDEAYKQSSYLTV